MQNSRRLVGLAEGEREITDAFGHRISALVDGSRGSPVGINRLGISEAIENNVPLTVIAENCGTSVRMIEETYAKVLFEKKRDFVEQGAPKLR